MANGREKEDRDIVTTCSKSSVNPKSRLNVELHPLQNLEVLSIVFSYCSVSDLKNCRLVGSKLWLEASLNSWREKAVLRINNQGCSNGKGISFEDFQLIYEDEDEDEDGEDDEDEEEKGERDEGGEEEEDDYEEEDFQLQRKPFRNIKLEGFFSLDGGHPKWSWIRENLSANLKHLTFAKCQFSTVKGFMHIIFWQLPNLVELKLMDNISFQYQPNEDITSYTPHLNLKSVILVLPLTPVLRSLGRRGRTEFPWASFFSRIPNLEHLKIKSKYQNTAEDVKQVLWSILRRREENKSNMKSLELSFSGFVDLAHVAPDDFTDLLPEHIMTDDDESMPLEEFTGSIIDIVTLKPYSKTLEYLNVFFTKNGEFQDPKRGSSASGKGEAIDNVKDITDEKISLPHVKEFHATGTASRVFKNLNKVDAPNLETLSVEDVPRVVYSNCWKSFDMAKLDNRSFEKVTRFECYVNSCHTKRYTFGVEEVKQFAKCMPNMLHVKMPLTGGAFTELCTTWGKLRTLTVLESCTKDEVGDEAITGFRDDEDPDKTDRLPNITDLKDLTDFVNPFMLTERSIKFGFMELPRLHYLNVRFNQIPEDAQSVLQSKVNILEIRE